MALVPTVTNANPSLSLLGSGGGGGGGGPVITASTITTETMNVSTIVGTPSAELTIGGTAVFIDTSLGMYFPTNGQINFQDGNGVLTGISSINGAVYPPAGASANISTITTGGGFFPPGTPVNLNPIAAPVQPNKWYMASVELTDMTFLPPPNATDCFNISIEDGTSQMNMGTFNMAQVSTNRGVLGEMGFSVCAPYESLSTNAYFVYRANSNAPSTFTVTGGIGWLQPLN